MLIGDASTPAEEREASPGLTREPTPFCFLSFLQNYQYVALPRTLPLERSTPPPPICRRNRELDTRSVYVEPWMASAASL